MSKLPALTQTDGVQQRNMFARAQSLIPAEKHDMADSAWIKRALSVEPGAERQGNTATIFRRTRSTQKEKLSIDDLEQIKASARRNMDSALLPASQRFVLSIDKELEEVLHAERHASTGPAHKDVSRRRRLAPLTTPALRFCDEEQSSAPATFHDGKTIRRERFQQSMPESRQLLDGMTHELEGIKTLRHSYPGAGLLLDLKQDCMAPERRSQLRFEPETARQRGTYVFGLNGDIVKSRSLVASLPPISTVDEEDLDKGQDASVANRARDVETELDDSRSVHARAGLKTAGGTDWQSLSAEGREIRLKNDFGALLVQYKKYVHELIVWNGLWYFKLPRQECHKMCVEILEIQQAFRAIVLSQRPLESHEITPDPLSEQQLHKHLKEGASSFITHSMLKDAARGDDELRDFEVCLFKFSRRADWRNVHDLRNTIMKSRETMAIRRFETETGKLKTQKASWQKASHAVQASLSAFSLGKNQKFTGLPKDSRIANALCDTLKDSTLDRKVAVMVDTVTCHDTESKKLQMDLDRAVTDQMNLTAQRKIDEIRTSMQTKHLTEVTDISQKVWGMVKLTSVPHLDEDKAAGHHLDDDTRHSKRRT